MIENYMLAWGVWLAGSFICLVVLARVLAKLPESVYYLFWWMALGIVLAPAAQEPGSPLWSPAVITAFFDAINGVEGGIMRAGMNVIIGAALGAFLGVVMSVVRTRKRLRHVNT
jgi:uncharacterized membrane protein YccC